MDAITRALRASVQGDPVWMRRINGWLTICWVAMMPVSIATGWVKSVTYVSALSLWALVSGHWSAWQAARVEVNQREEAEAREAADVPGDVVERIVRDTQLERQSSPVTAEVLATGEPTPATTSRLTGPTGDTSDV
jgi:hypothetical protein